MSDRTEGKDETTGWNRHMAGLMIESIRLARSKKPDSWSAYEVKGTAKVNVGKRTIGVLGPNILMLLVNTFSLTQDERKDADRYLDPRNKFDKTYSGVVMIEFSQEHAEEVVRLFRASHLSTVRRVSEQASSQREKRDDKVVAEIERIAGATIRQS